MLHASLHTKPRWKYPFAEHLPLKSSKPAPCTLPIHLPYLCTVLAFATGLYVLIPALNVWIVVCAC